MDQPIIYYTIYFEHKETKEVVVGTRPLPQQVSQTWLELIQKKTPTHRCWLQPTTPKS